MRNKQKFLKKSKEVKTGMMTRASQLRAQMKVEEHTRHQMIIEDDDNDDFIENDMRVDEPVVLSKRKRVKTTVKTRNPKKSLQSKNQVEKAKFDHDSKDIMRQLREKQRAKKIKINNLDLIAEQQRKLNQKFYRNSKSRTR